MSLRLPLLTMLLVAGLFSFPPIAARGATEANITPNVMIPCPPAPCVSSMSFKDAMDKLINNGGKNLAQDERGSADEAVRRDAENQWNFNDTDYREKSRNRETRLQSAYAGDRANRASATLGQEWAAVQTIGTVANTSGATENSLVQLLGQYNDAVHTAGDIHSGMLTGLNRAMAYACNAGCVSQAWADALKTNNSIKGCRSDPDVANSLVNPNELRRGLPKNKSISLAPGSKEVKCIAAFNQLVQSAMGMDDILRNAKANSAQAANLAVRQAQAQNAVLAALNPLRADMALPNASVSNAKQYDTKEKAAKLYGVDCRGDGLLPSQKCSTAWQLAATRAQLDQQSRQIDTDPSSADRTAAVLSASSASIQQAAYKQAGGSMPLPEANNLDKLLVAYFDRPEVIAYMNSAEFGKNVLLAMQEIPLIERRVDVAMNEYWSKSSKTFQEYDLAQIYPDTFNAYYAEHPAAHPSVAQFLADHGIPAISNDYEAYTSMAQLGAN